MMLTFRQNTFPYRRQSNYKTGLGNTTPRYNSQVNTQRKKYYINSTRNSQDAPQWMSRTQQHFLRSNTAHKRSSSIHANPESSFMSIKQTYVYDSLPKAKNPSGQFAPILHNTKPRNKWEMKGHTFEFEWPKKQSPSELRESRVRESRVRGISAPRTEAKTFFKYEMPKYGIRESPLYRQRETQLKIGHSAMVDSVYVK